MKISVSGEVSPYTLEVPSIWEMVRQIRQGVGERLEGHDEDLRDGTVLTVSELSENLVKYVSGERAPESSLTVYVSQDKVTIRSENVVSDTGHAQRVMTIVEEIAAHDDPEELYAQSIARGLDNPDNRVSCQGLYRIVAVGGFELSATCAEDRLVIFAERAIA